MRSGVVPSQRLPSTRTRGPAGIGTQLEVEGRRTPHGAGEHRSDQEGQRDHREHRPDPASSGVRRRGERLDGGGGRHRLGRRRGRAAPAPARDRFQERAGMADLRALLLQLWLEEEAHEVGDGGGVRTEGVELGGQGQLQRLG